MKVPCSRKFIDSVKLNLSGTLNVPKISVSIFKRQIRHGNLFYTLHLCCIKFNDSVTLIIIYCLTNVLINAERLLDLNGNSEKRDFMVKRIEFEHINFKTLNHTKIFMLMKK